MRIQRISTYQQRIQNFKGYSLYEDYDSDYGTYYNQVTIKDAVVSASIVSGILTLGGILFSNADKISKFCSDILKRLGK